MTFCVQFPSKQHAMVCRERQPSHVCVCVQFPIMLIIIINAMQIPCACEPQTERERQRERQRERDQATGSGYLFFAPCHPLFVTPVMLLSICTVAVITHHMTVRSSQHPRHFLFAIFVVLVIVSPGRPCQCVFYYSHSCVIHSWSKINATFRNIQPFQKTPGGYPAQGRLHSLVKSSWGVNYNRIVVTVITNGHTVTCVQVFLKTASVIKTFLS